MGFLFIPTLKIKKLRLKEIKEVIELGFKLRISKALCYNFETPGALSFTY